MTDRCGVIDTPTVDFGCRWRNSPSRFSPCPPFISLPTSFFCDAFPTSTASGNSQSSQSHLGPPPHLALVTLTPNTSWRLFFCRHYPRLSTLWTCSHMPQHPLTCPMPSPHHQDTDRSWGQQRYVTATGCSLTLTDALPHPHPPFNALVHLLNHAPQTPTPSTLPTASLPRFSPLPRLASPCLPVATFFSLGPIFMRRLSCVYQSYSEYQRFVR